MRELEYPFDGEYILKKSKSIKKQLLADPGSRLPKKIAVLGGSTTHDIIRVLELFLLNYGIEPVFYESEYGQYWQDAMFDNEELKAFGPDIIYIHTSNRNITRYPAAADEPDAVEELKKSQYEHFESMWERLAAVYHCPIIQNNFELPSYRLMGNAEASLKQGRVRFINEMNLLFADYADRHENFHINDINYLSAAYGLDKWSDSFYWHMYKYALSLEAIPTLAFNVAGIIKALYGKNKKALVLDLDNTLWGGIVGDDGAENLEIGQETSMGQVYSEFQTYLKAHKDIGVLLNVDSKNDKDNALAGLNRPDSVLKPEDFIVIRANWEPKSVNLSDIARTLNLGEDSLVFVDDNPAEREIIRQQNPGVAVPELDSPEKYIRILDRSGYFEVTTLNEDDRKRNEMYRLNVRREEEKNSFADYGEYLKSLDMKADIRAFEPMYNARIAQLTNKSNQFNLTTKRFTQADIEGFADNKDYITLYGKLTDKFGDNGVVTVVLARCEGEIAHIELWLMSCRVLKRDMEYAMMDELVRLAALRGVRTLRGYYYKTAKNAMVRDFYSLHGFECVSTEGEDTRWELKVEDYVAKRPSIEVTTD